MTPEAQRLAEECKRLAGSYGAACELGYIGRIEPGWQAFTAAIDQLASMIPAGGLAEEAQDAARYRWLRRHSYIHAVGSLNYGGGCWQTMPELLDEAIDAALSAPTPQQEHPR